MAQMNKKLVESVVRSVVGALLEAGLSPEDILSRIDGTEAAGRKDTGGGRESIGADAESFGEAGKSGDRSGGVEITEDITDRAVKAVPLIETPQDKEALERMMRLTTARIGVGRCGSRLKTKTLLTLRADHAKARDAVMTDVDEAVLKELSLFSVKTCCRDKNEYLTRPDLGRKLSSEAVEVIKQKCKKTPDVQICVSDGLSSAAINANAAKLLPVLYDGLKAKGLTVGTPFFIKYGRVGVEDEIAELVGARVVCILVGERPGLGSAESMSAYLAYNARVGMPEARRTVVSNIHKDGINAAEAGAYMADLIEKIYQTKASGVELKN